MSKKAPVSGINNPPSVANRSPTGQANANPSTSTAKAEVPPQTPATRRFNRQDYDEYSRVMRSLGYGIPILKPCPTALTNSAAIGDVGYMRDGEFVKLYNVKDIRGRQAPKFEPKPRLFETVEQKRMNGMGAIISAGIESKLSQGSKLHEVTVNAGTNSGVALFPLYGLQLESITKQEKDGLERFMKDEIQNWAHPPNLTRDDLLLVHSRIMAAKWMMTRFEVIHKDNNKPGFTVNIDEGKVISPSSASFHFAIESGVDNLALQGSNLKPNKSITHRLPSETTPLLDVNSPIRTSNCVFLGVFRTSTSGGIEDTASRLERATNSG